MKNAKIGIILANLGGPSNSDEIYPFLRNLFSDRDIFRLPFGSLGQHIFSWLIASLRKSKSKKYYDQIGGGSPIYTKTKLLAEELQEKFNRIINKNKMNVFFFQRYWHPYAKEVAEIVKQYSFEKNILLPLYPQYSTTTSQSVINEWQRVSPLLPETSVIERFYNSSEYSRICAELIDRKLSIAAGNFHILFTAHSIPVKRIQMGDPYEKETRENMISIMNSLTEDYSFSLCFQSKVGPLKWLEPSFEKEIDRLVAKKIDQIVVFPISFVSENLETLYELDIQKKTYALKRGIKKFIRIETIQQSPLFTDFLFNTICEYCGKDFHNSL
ncbi:MAG: ferrochelatase [Chitinispirillia bacterium]|jgi:ferrochelatase